MINDIYRYIKTVFEGNKFLNDTGSEYVLVSQKAYKGKLGDDNKVILPPGVKLTLQIIIDNSAPIVSKDDGRIKENNVLNTFEVDVPGVTYPLDAKKGDHIHLGGYLEEYSYYINNKELIFRCSKVEVAKNNAARPNNHD